MTETKKRTARTRKKTVTVEKPAAPAARRVAVYAGTRNLYPRMIPAAKSLANQTRMDRIVFLIEDDTFPEPLPSYVDVINVSGQHWFRPDGPNYSNPWTWMSLMRLVIPRLLPEENRCLYLDCDTIVQQDIGGLFETDLRGKLMAGVVEPRKCWENIRYFNAGVLLMDLEALRSSGKVSEMVSSVHYRRWGLPDQDVLNACCSNRMMTLPPEYNATRFIPHDENAVKILHYAANRQCMKEPAFREAANLAWKDWGDG